MQRIQWKFIKLLLLNISDHCCVLFVIFCIVLMSFTHISILFNILWIGKLAISVCVPVYVAISSFGVDVWRVFLERQLSYFDCNFTFTKCPQCIDALSYQLYTFQLLAKDESPWITIFGSRVRRFANDFHEWRSHEWKSLANRITQIGAKAIFTSE